MLNHAITQLISVVPRVISAALYDYIKKKITERNGNITREELAEEAANYLNIEGYSVSVEGLLKVMAGDKGAVNIKDAHFTSTGETFIDSEAGGRLTMQDSTSRTPYSVVESYGGALAVLRGEASIQQSKGIVIFSSGKTGAVSIEGSFVVGPKHPDDAKGFSIGAPNAME